LILEIYAVSHSPKNQDLISIDGDGLAEGTIETWEVVDWVHIDPNIFLNRVAFDGVG